jgi:hypothetical protein
MSTPANTGYNYNETRVRVGGSGFTVFHWRSQPIAFARQIAHTGPEPVGPGPVAIQPMDAKRPVQVITPEAAGMGSLTLELYELYGERVWDRLVREISANGEVAHDLVDVFRIVAASPDPINMTKFIKPPVLGGNTSIPTYAEQYYGCVITNVQNGETIEIGTMEVLKQITVAYRYMRIIEGNRSANDAPYFGEV